MPKAVYGARWRKYRAKYLAAHPLCVMHLERGQFVSAEVVDHIKPHKGDEQLFWNQENHQALCKQCHDSHKQRFEKSGIKRGCRSDGVPLDSEHHWHKG